MLPNTTTTSYTGFLDFILSSHFLHLPMDKAVTLGVGKERLVFIQFSQPSKSLVFHEKRSEMFHPLWPLPSV